MSMSSAWEAAERRCAATPRRFVDWGAFWHDEESIKADDHRIYLSSIRSLWDDCCHRQICDSSLAPYPATAIVGPYLKALVRDLDLPPVVDHPYLIHRTPPLYFDHPYEGPLVYVDLVRAYWSIYTRTTLDVFYDGYSSPRRGLVEWQDKERLGEDRLVRNAVIGFLRREWRRGLDHGEPFKEAVPYGRRRPDLWGLVMDSLEVVAWSMRDLGAIYVHTDGYIFPHHDLAEDAIALLAERFGLEGTVRKQGEGWVHGLGRFKIGEDQYGGQELVPVASRSAIRKIDSMLRTPQKMLEDLTAWLAFT